MQPIREHSRFILCLTILLSGMVGLALPDAHAAEEIHSSFDSVPASFPRIYFAMDSMVDPAPVMVADPLPESLSAFARLLAADAWTTVKAPLSWTTDGWIMFGFTAATILGTSRCIDHGLDKFNQGPNRTMERRLWTHVSDWGVGIPYALIGAHGLIGYSLGQNRAKRVFLDGIESVTIVSALLLAFKISIGRSLPDSRSRAYQFKPFHNGWDTAFPSGHTVQAFVVATVLATSYPEYPWVGIGAMSIASAVGFSRLYLHEHWLSDVMAGAVLAIAVGWEIVSLHRHPAAGAANEIPAPTGYRPARIGVMINDGDTGLTLEWRF